MSCLSIRCRPPTPGERLANRVMIRQKEPPLLGGDQRSFVRFSLGDGRFVMSQIGAELLHDSIQPYHVASRFQCS